MKILVIHTIGSGKAESGIHRWRLWKPMEELKKHVDWQIDYQTSHIKDLDKFKDKTEFTNEELEKAAEHLGSYDIVFSSYYANPAAFSLCQVVSDRYGTKFIMDDDDDMFSIDPSNPIWEFLSDNHIFGMQRMLRNAPYITTTTEHLADVYREKSEVDGKVYVLPNYISKHYREHNPDNGDDVVIGYFGGGSHYKDLNETGATQAIEKLMHKHKNVRFKCMGVRVEANLPAKRRDYFDVVPAGDLEEWALGELGMDISIAPLRDTLFARAKSNIKWQESTRVGAAFVASNVGPYAKLSDDVAVKVENDSDAWFEALESLVLDVKKRKKLVASARKDIESNWRLEDNWQAYKTLFETVKGDK